MLNQMNQRRATQDEIARMIEIGAIAPFDSGDGISYAVSFFRFHVARGQIERGLSPFFPCFEIQPVAAAWGQVNIIPVE